VTSPLPAPATDDVSDRTPSGRFAYPVAVLGLVILVLGLAGSWALTLPPFQGPDEVAHYNSVARLVAGDGWPRPYDAKITDATVTAVAEAGSAYQDQGLAALPDPEDRSLLLEGQDWERNGTDQMVQHPPLAYAVTASVVKVLGGADLRWDHAQLIMRAVSALMLCASVPFLVGIARRMTGSRIAGVVGGGGVLLVPFFSNVGGFITNDALLITLCSAALFFAVSATTGRRPLLLLAAAGAVLGLALLTKGLALFLIPVIAVFAVMTAVRVTGWLRKIAAVAIPLAIAFCVGGWWWLRNIVTLGRIQPSQLGDRESQLTAPDEYDPWLFVGNFIVRFNRTFWGRGAREDLAFPTWAVDVAGVLLLLAVVASLVLARRRIALAALWAFPVLIIATTAANAHSIYWDLGDPSRGVQGRYIFAGIAAMAATLGILFAALSRRLAIRDGVSGAVAVVLGAAVSVWGLVWVFDRVWGADGVAGAAQAHGVAAWLYVATGVLGLCGLVIAAAALVSAEDARGRLR
jgi:4-amino-4-deoxy-L-arabinose transferase-like glycosyltransferase